MIQNASGQISWPLSVEWSIAYDTVVELSLKDPVLPKFDFALVERNGSSRF